jgi:hypothetical protein
MLETHHAAFAPTGIVDVGCWFSALHAQAVVATEFFNVDALNHLLALSACALSALSTNALLVIPARNANRSSFELSCGAMRTLSWTVGFGFLIMQPR